MGHTTDVSYLDTVQSYLAINFLLSTDYEKTDTGKTHSSCGYDSIRMCCNRAEQKTIVEQKNERKWYYNVIRDSESQQ